MYNSVLDVTIMVTIGAVNALEASGWVVVDPPATITTVRPRGLTIPNASTTVAGKVELATNNEAITGTDTVRANTPAGTKAAFTSWLPVFPVEASYATGVVDATARITAQIAAATAAGGGIVELPAGVLSHTGFVWPTGVHVWGKGEQVTTLHLANGSNTDSIVSTNFASLTGSGSTGGIHDCSLAMLTVDGNKAHQTGTSYGIRAYGYSMMIRDVTVRDALTDGVATEWKGGGSSPAAPHYNMESHFERITVLTCGRRGFDNLGPHDSIWRDCTAIKNAAEGFYPRNAGSSGAAGAQYYGCHAWGNEHTYGFRLGCAVFGIGNYAEGASVANVSIEAGGQAHWLGAIVLGAGATTPVGISVGVIGGTAISGWDIQGVIEDCTSGAVAFVNDSDNRYKLFVNQSSGTVQSGTAGASSEVVIHAIGQSSTVNTQESRNITRGKTTVRATGGNGFLVTDPSGLDALNVNLTNGRVEIPRGRILRFFSDSYTTETVEIDGSTGRITFGDNTAGPVVLAGSGTPEGVITAPVGSWFLRSDGGVATVVYVKQTGTGNTGWHALPGAIDGPLGAARTIDARVATAVAAFSAANQCRYVRMRGAHAGATGLWIWVGTQSGNISVGIVPNNGSSGVDALPSGNRKATSGTVACPTGGQLSFVPFTAACNIDDGDWAVLTADNTTVTFGRATMIMDGSGVAYKEASAHPVPSTVGTLTTSNNAFFASSR